MEDMTAATIATRKQTMALTSHPFHATGGVIS
jgi:hypothetical protein